MRIKGIKKGMIQGAGRQRSREWKERVVRGVKIKAEKETWSGR